ncbi:hypothetical protein [Microbacterium azadirachtae]|uniref:SipW-cognate class signal peptide n=1 Tax=Microbacterium azadirachtae TaxID=582680 RepID=A0A0F0LHM0_9MICO|nr:hypothetical protein [Microbacterium azadirachtae]KJL32653.1 hypothetical protein RS86_02434 [Microbacterium azadirachtae]
MTDVKSGLSRRTVIKSAAWSVPVIAVAAAAPMAAASTTTNPKSVGPLVESSPNVKDSVLSASSSRVEACFPNDTFSTPFNLIATVTFDNSDPAFSLAGATVTSAGNVWTVASRTATSVTLTATQTVACYSGITGFDLAYNAGSAVPPLNSLTLNISGVSTDGTRKIDGLISSLDNGPVVGPKVHDA